MLSLSLIIVLSYLAGSIPGSLWVGKLYGVDLRQHGSGNPGATNAYRVLGWKAGVLATIVDMGKGFLAAAVISRLRVDTLPAWFDGFDQTVTLGFIAGVAAVIGHMIPIFAGFKGGKGVNTAAGALLAITPVNILISFVTFCLVLWTTRYVSLSSMLAAVVYPVSLLIQKFGFGQTEIGNSVIGFGAILALAIVLAHQSNIKRLLAGTENRISWVKEPTLSNDECRVSSDE